MKRNQIVLWTVAAVYIAISLFLLAGRIPSLHEDKLQLFFKDLTIPERVHATIIEDHNGQTVLITRIFHNKLFFSLNNMFVSLSRSTDPTYLYSFSDSLFFESKKGLLPLFEFPFFLIASVTLIRRWHLVKKKYPFILPMLFISLFIAMLFIPYSASLKLIPLVITLQLMTVIGLYELLSILLWRKK